MREHRPEETRRLLGEEAARARAAGEHRRTVEALRALARVEADLGNDQAALERYEQAVAAARALGDARLIAHTIRHHADILRRAGRHEDARPHYLEALALYRADSTTAPGELANAVRPTALLMEALGEEESARTHWREALQLYERAGVEAGVDECRAALARLGQGEE